MSDWHLSCFQILFKRTRLPSFLETATKPTRLAHWLGNVLGAKTACAFSTSQLPKVVRTCGLFTVPSWLPHVLRCASMCFAPQRRAIFHLISQDGAYFLSLCATFLPFRTPVSFVCWPFLFWLFLFPDFPLEYWNITYYNKIKLYVIHMSSNFFTAVRCCEQDMLSCQDTESKAAQATATGSRPWWLHPTIQPKLPRSSSRLLFLIAKDFYGNLENCHKLNPPNSVVPM